MARLRIYVGIGVGALCVLPLVALGAILVVGIPITLVVEGWRVFSANPEPYLTVFGVLAGYELLLRH